MNNVRPNRNERTIFINFLPRQRIAKRGSAVNWDISAETVNERNNGFLNECDEKWARSPSAWAAVITYRSRIVRLGMSGFKPRVAGRFG
jgi:hypothetical protein